MPIFAANISFLFTELPFLDRCDAAADAGFSAVECLFPYDEVAADELAARLAREGLTLALFNMPPGDWQVGERGLAVLAGRRDEFRAGLKRAATYAQATGVSRLHLLAGVAPADDPEAAARYREAVVEAAELLGPLGVDVLVEPINSRDIPGYFLNDFNAAKNLVESLGLANVKLQFDLYHRQIICGDVTVGLRALLPLVGHVQVAGVPGRHEPDEGELNCGFLFAELDRLGYAGFVGCEYRPRGGTSEGLRWFAPYARPPRTDAKEAGARAESAPERVLQLP